MQEKKASYIYKNLSKPKADQPWGWGENKQVIAEQKLEGGSRVQSQPGLTRETISQNRKPKHLPSSTLSLFAFIPAPWES